MSRPTSDSMSESREDVFAAPSLLEFFCQRTARDFRARARREMPGMPWLGMVGCLLVCMVAWIGGQAILMRIFTILLILQIFWTIWVLVVRSGSHIRQQAEDVARGRFAPETTPLVLARLRWWNHLISPRKWARHSRIHGRRTKLVKRIEEIKSRLRELEKSAEAKSATRPPTLPVHLRNRVAVEERLQNAARHGAEMPRLREELQVFEALAEQIESITTKLDNIAGLEITLRDAAGGDMTQMVTDALTVLEERRELVKDVDAVDPEEFIGMITV